jgi:hypothetical protein
MRVGRTHSLDFTIEMATPSDIGRRYGNEPGQIVDLETRWERIRIQVARGSSAFLVTSWAPRGTQEASRTPRSSGALRSGLPTPRTAGMSQARPRP